MLRPNGHFSADHFINKIGITMIIDVFLSGKREEFIEQRSLCSLLSLFKWKARWYFSECFERCFIEKIIIIAVLSHLKISVPTSGCRMWPLSFPQSKSHLFTYTMSAELPSWERVTCGVSVSLRKPEVRERERNSQLNLRWEEANGGQFKVGKFMSF